MSYFKKLQALVFLLSFSNCVAYSDTPVLFQKPLFAIKKSQLERFFEKNLQLTLFEYGGNLGIMDFLMVGESHHYWAQIGILSFDLSSLLGSGVGYRYLFGKDNTNQAWFLGIYGYNRWKGQFLNWSIGVEAATKYLQGTLNRYSAQPNSNSKTDHDLAKDIGYSLRISTYYFEKIHWFGRINPFFFVARTKRYSAQKDQVLRPKAFWNRGVGVRWDFSSITFEFKVIGDTVKPSQFLKARYHIGCHINFYAKEIAKNDAKSRVRQVSEHYEPSYYKYHDNFTFQPPNDLKKSKPRRKKNVQLVKFKPSHQLPKIQEESQEEIQDQLSIFVQILTTPEEEARHSVYAMINALQDRLNRCIIERGTFCRSVDYYNYGFLDLLINTMVKKEKEFRNYLEVEQGVMEPSAIENIDNGSQDIYLEGIYTIMERLDKKGTLNEFLTQARIIRKEKDNLDKYWQDSDHIDNTELTFA